MIFLVIITLFTTPSLAVLPSSISSGASSTTISSTIAQWIDLYKQIYDNTMPAVETMRIGTILTEMFEIEKTEPFKIGLRPLIESGWYRIDPFKQLVQRYNKTNFLNNRDATITDLLLRTFDHESNDCTADYFEKLADIYNHFLNRPIARGLQDNRELQYKNCWRRLMNILAASSMVLGSSVRNRLDDLALLAYFSPDDSLGLDCPVEISRIAEVLGQFLGVHADRTHVGDTWTQFHILVKQPCKVLIESSSQQITDRIREISKLSGDNRHFITSEDASIIKRYMLCHRIMAMPEFILCDMIKHVDVTRDHSHSNRLLELTADEIGNFPSRRSTGTTQINPSISTDLKLGFPIDDSADLVTQQLPFDISEDKSCEDNRDRQEEMNDTAAEPILADGTESGIQPKQNPKIVSIDKTVGMGMATRYITRWSDGSKTLERRQFLRKNWPQEMKAFHKKRKSAYNAKYLNNLAKENISCQPDPSRLIDQDRVDKRRKLSEEVTPYDAVESNNMVDDNTRVVVSVGKCKGRGVNAKYPTLWSDDTTSMESKSSLLADWPDQFNSLMRRNSSDKYFRYAHGDEAGNAPRYNYVKKRPRKSTLNLSRLSKSKLDRLDIRETDTSRTVVQIKRGFGRGMNIRYPTVWSDGTESNERWEYLIVNWPDAWQHRLS